jgi:hypothetical protein
MSGIARILVAFVLAPLLPALAIAAVVAVGSRFAAPAIEPSAHFTYGLIWLYFAAIGTYAATALFGLPTFFVLRHRGWLNRSSAQLAGFIIGVLVGGAAASIFFWSPVYAAGLSLVAGVLGLAAAALFWFVAYGRKVAQSGA